MSNFCYYSFQWYPSKFLRSFECRIICPSEYFSPDRASSPCHQTQRPPPLLLQLQQLSSPRTTALETIFRDGTSKRLVSLTPLSTASSTRSRSPWLTSHSRAHRLWSDRNLLHKQHIWRLLWSIKLNPHVYRMWRFHSAIWREPRIRVVCCVLTHSLKFKFFAENKTTVKRPYPAAPTKYFPQRDPTPARQLRNMVVWSIGAPIVSIGPFLLDSLLLRPRLKWLLPPHRKRDVRSLRHLYKTLIGLSNANGYEFII